MDQVIRRMAAHDGATYYLTRATPGPIWLVRQGDNELAPLVGVLQVTTDGELPDRLKAFNPSAEYPEAKLRAIYAASTLIAPPRG